MKQKRKEWFIGFVIGVILSLLMTVKVLASEPIEINEDIEFWSEYYGDKYDIEPELIQAVCWVESRCDNTAQSADKSCKGLMQIHVKSHVKRMQKLKVQNIFSIQGNIKVGTDYLAEISENEDIETALAIYNGQSDKAVNNARKGIYGEYIKEVLRVRDEIKRTAQDTTPQRF